MRLEERLLAVSSHMVGSVGSGTGEGDTVPRQDPRKRVMVLPDSELGQPTEVCTVSKGRLLRVLRIAGRVQGLALEIDRVSATYDSFRESPRWG